MECSTEYIENALNEKNYTVKIFVEVNIKANGASMLHFLNQTTTLHFCSQYFVIPLPTKLPLYSLPQISLLCNFFHSRHFQCIQY
jgi:hypothetical protein